MNANKYPTEERFVEWIDAFFSGFIITFIKFSQMSKDFPIRTAGLDLLQTKLFKNIYLLTTLP